MRTFSSLAIMALLVLPQTLRAQEVDERLRRSVVSVGSFVGLGGGPSVSGAWGLEAELPLGGRLALRAEYSRTTSGLGTACVQSWPESYSCDVGGWAALAGLSVGAPSIGRLAPYAEVSAGRFARDRGAADDVGSTALVLGAGARVRLSRGWSARLGARYLRASDDDYEALMGEGLRYTLGIVGVEYRIHR